MAGTESLSLSRPMASVPPTAARRPSANPEEGKVKIAVSRQRVFIEFT